MWVLWRHVRIYPIRNRDSSYSHGDSPWEDPVYWKYVDCFEGREECERRAEELNYSKYDGLTPETSTRLESSAGICRPVGHNANWEVKD